MNIGTRYSLVALALCAGVATLAGPVRDAAAAPAVSPFAGSYGPGPWAGGGWYVTISRTGAVQGDFVSSGPNDYAGSFHGTVSADGSMACSGSISWRSDGGFVDQSGMASLRGSTKSTQKFAFHATASLDTYGNVAGTVTEGTFALSGGSFLWFRR